MRAVMVSDFAILRKNLVNGVIITICLVFFFAAIDGDVLPAMIVGPISLGYVSLMVLFSLDEQNKWQEMRLAMPISRSEVVIGRYLSILLCSLLGVAVVLAVIAVIALLALAMPGNAVLVSCVSSCDAGSIVLMVGISLVLCLSATALAAPVVFRLGFTGAVRYLPFAFFALIIAVVCFAKLVPGGESLGAWLGGLLDSITLQLAPLGMGAILIAGMLAVYAASVVISVKLYRGRSF
ncbi:MAG: ABC-2 transporter permease [Eggerthellaceae bacterium]